MRAAIADSLDYAQPADRPSWIYAALFVVAAPVVGAGIVGLRSARALGSAGA